MRRDCDAASSVVIGFVILLMLVALGIGIWALISVPDMVKEAESTHAIELSNTFLDLKLSADKVRVNNFEGARFSMLMPGSSGMSGTTISFTKDMNAKFHIYDGNTGALVTHYAYGWEGNFGRLSAQVGGTRGTTMIGYEAGGVFRSDNGNAVWLTPGLIQIYPDETETNATVRVDVVMLNLSGEYSISSNWGAPVSIVYQGSVDPQESASVKNNIMNATTLTLSFTPSDEMQKNLWYAMFSEVKERYAVAVDEFMKKYPDRPSVDPENLKISIDPQPQLNILVRTDEWVKVYIREATYDVSLVNRYEES